MKKSKIDLYKEEITVILAKNGYLWSYDTSKKGRLCDKELIEKSLIHLEFEDMYLLFSAYPFKKIKQVWQETLLQQNDYYNVLNKLLAALFFNIKHPNKYIEKHVGKRIN